MPHPYKLLLTIILVLLPYLILAYRNRFDRPLNTCIRFFAAILAVWVYLLAMRFLVDFIDVRLATTQEEFDSIYNGDGARNVFTLFFGWVPGVILATMSWVVARAWHWFKTRKPRAAT